jgi:hypothetical protein
VRTDYGLLIALCTAIKRAAKNDLPPERKTPIMRRRTIILLVLTVVCGLGLGLLASFSDGFYTAICLLLYPYLTALMFLFISIDIASPPPLSTRREIDATTQHDRARSKGQAGVMENQRQARI